VREDVEVHYWWCESFRGEYRAFNDNVLMPRGNYAARIMRDGGQVLVFTFYVDGLDVASGTRSLPPPKQVRRRSDGKLELVSYHRWAGKVKSAASLQMDQFKACLENPTAACEAQGERLRFSCRSGFELFLAPVAEPFWIWELEWQTLQQGGCGLVFDLDERFSGYFISLDTERGTASIRAWGSRPERVFQNYIYEGLQTGEFTAIADRRYALRLIRWGSYIELSVNGVVRLSLVDARFIGRRLGIFLESAEIALSSLSLSFLEPPVHDQA